MPLSTQHVVPSSMLRCRLNILNKIPIMFLMLWNGLQWIKYVFVPEDNEETGYGKNQCKERYIYFFERQNLGTHTGIPV